MVGFNVICVSIIYSINLSPDLHYMRFLLKISEHVSSLKCIHCIENARPEWFLCREEKLDYHFDDSFISYTTELFIVHYFLSTTFYDIVSFNELSALLFVKLYCLILLLNDIYIYKAIAKFIWIMCCTIDSVYGNLLCD